MRNIVLIFKNSVQRGLLLIPIFLMATGFLMFAFSTVASPRTGGVEEIRLGLIDQDDSPLSGDLKKYFEQTLSMQVTQKGDYDFQSGLLIDKNISAIIEIPQGFYDSAAEGDIKEPVITTLDDYENAAFIEVYVDSYMRGIKVMSDAAAGDRNLFSQMLLSHVKTGGVELCEERETGGANVHFAFVLAEGVMIMSIAGIILFVSNSIMSDIRQGTYSRIVCSPVKPMEYIAGTALFGLVCGTLMNIAFTVYAYASQDGILVPWEVSAGAGELFVLFSVGFSILLALLIREKRTLFTVGVGYTTFGCMLGGAWFPIADGLGFIGNVAKMFPQYWFMRLLRDAGNSGQSPFTALCILALFALLAYLIPAVVFSRKSS